MVGLAYALSGSPSGADELAQSAFRAAHRRWARLPGGGGPGAWVRRAVADRAGSPLRRRGAELRGRSRPRPDALRSEAEEYWRAVRSLPAPQALAVALHVLEGLPVEEIALVLGGGPEAARGQLDRGRQALAASLGPDDGGRARSAASALWASVEPLEPGIGDAVPEPRSYRTVALVTAVVLAVGGAAVGVAVLDDGRDSTDVVTGVVDVPRLTFAVIPPGLVLSTAEELPAPTEGVPDVSLTLYGDPEADDPFAEGDLALAVTRSVAPLTVEGLTGDRALTVRGHRGRLYDMDDPIGVTSLEWSETPQIGIALRSRTLAERQLVAAAEGLVLDGSSVRPGPLPEGLTEVARQNRVTLVQTGTGQPTVPPDARGWAVTYTEPVIDESIDDRRTVAVATHTGGKAHLQVLRWWYDGRPVEVRGHPGISGADGDAVLTWLEGDDIAVTMTGVGLFDRGPDDLLRFARSLDRVGPTAWDRLVRQAAGPP